VLLNEAEIAALGRALRYIAVITNDHCRVTTKDFLFMGEAACRGPRERHSPGPNLALKFSTGLYLDLVLNSFSPRPFVYVCVKYNVRCFTCTSSRALLAFGE